MADGPVQPAEAPTSADVPVVAPKRLVSRDVTLVAIKAEENSAVTDALKDAKSRGPDDQIGDRLFGLTEAPADVAERMKAHPDAGAGLLGTMVEVESNLASDEEATGADAVTDAEPYGIWVGKADRGPGVYEFKPLPKPVETPTEVPVVPPSTAQ